MGALSSLIVLIENALYPLRVINGYFGKFFNRILGKRAFSLTLAGKVAIAFLVCFVLFITIVMLMHIFFGEGWSRDDLTGSFIVDFILFYLGALVISIGLYWGIRLATREKPSLYPEIDQCWNAFEKWREKQNLNWHEFSRFLVLGSDLEISKAMHADMKDKKIGAVPSGANDWMHWFGTTESQYLHLKKISHTNHRLQRLQSSQAGSGGVTFSPDNTLQASVGVAQWSAEIGTHDATAEVSDYGNSIGDFGGSLDAASSLDAFGSDSADPTDVNVASASSNTNSEAEFLTDDDDSPAERIHYLAKMMQAKTAGEIPFHGVVVTIPFDKFLMKDNFKSITASVKQDLLQLREVGEVMFPVSIVFSSMEKDQGFPKLQNLLGTQRATAGRFGAGCRVEDVPTIDEQNLDIQARKACLSFEDWVVNRWAKPSQLARAAQNKELYKMIVRIRQQFKPRLEHLLQEALIWTPSESPNGEMTDVSLAGCYFVSTGQHSSDRGFLNGLFLKCQEFAEASGWADSILSRDRVFSIISTLLFLGSIITLTAVGIFYFQR